MLNIFEYKVIIKLVLKQLQNIRNTVTIFSIEILIVTILMKLGIQTKKKRFFFVFKKILIVDL